MNNVIHELKHRRSQGMKQAFKRGTTPVVDLVDESFEWRGGLLFLQTASAVFIIGWISMAWMHIKSAFVHAGIFSIVAGLVVALLYYILPFFKVLGFTLWHRQRPTRQMLDQFSFGQNFVCLGLIALGSFYLFNYLYPILRYTLRHHRWPIHWYTIKPLVTVWWLWR